VSDGLQQQVLDDLLLPNLKVVFCGTQAGREAAEQRRYYVGRGNKFWHILPKIGLLPPRFDPRDFARLPEFCVGLTDIAQTTFGPDSALRRHHFDVDGFKEKICRSAPHFVAFNGKRAAAVALNVSGIALRYGLQKAHIGISKVFVFPSTSGAANAHWDERHWFELARQVREQS
jgi:TDG/mug DNA glycosylase family protein